MSVLTDLLDAATGGGFTRALAGPRPGASDEDIMRLYQGRYNQYATPEALRDVERGIQYYVNDPRTRFRFTLDGLRDQGLRSRGLGIDQGFHEIPDYSPTGRFLKGIINLPSTGEYSGA